MFANIQGKLVENYNLSKLTWFQVGGQSKYFFKPKNIADLAFFIKNKPQNIPVFVLGAGSNVLIRDKGYDGVTIKLSSEFAKFNIENGVVIAGAGVLDRTLALSLAEEGFSNLEFLVGIPGTIGGAIAMNAGAYGSEVIDHLLWIEIMNENGDVQKLFKNDLSMSYRCGNLPKNSIVLKAAFALQKSNPKDVQKTIADILEKRAETQPVVGRTGGSTFKNPQDSSAWKLIDDAGCRGYAIGPAKISTKHCNFMINEGGASAKQLEDLGEYVREKVFEKTGYKLEWEIKRIGR